MLTLAYDGRNYAGMVVQDNAATVGGALLEAIHSFDPEVDKLRVASRTDAGVHARDQRVAFDTSKSVPLRGWVLGLNQRLPSSVAVRRATAVPAGFNPRFVTEQKHYRYLVLCDRAPDPFLAGRAWRLHDLRPSSEALERMQAELDVGLGEHDFAGFASARDQRDHTTRTMHRLRASWLTPVLLALDVVGDGFLHNMVRIMVGTVVDVGRGRLEPGAVARTLRSGDRRDAGMTAPAEGLYLERISLADVDDGDARGASWPELP